MSMTTTIDSSASAIEPLFTFLSYALIQAELAFFKIPGSHVVARYIKSSHQNDPGRTVLEILLALFAIRTLLQSRTRADNGEKHFIQFSKKEIDELVDEWTPEPLGAPLTAEEETDLASIPVVSGPNGPRPKLANTGKQVLNLASYNFTGLAGNETIKQRATETLRKYGVGSCGPPGFYGTIDLHMDLERDIADFLGAEAAILYSQAFSTVPSVISAFAKRGDIIVADRGVNFAIQKGLQISRSTIRWFDHNDLKSLEEVIQGVEKDRRKRRGPVTRRFIITEGIFEKDGTIVDLPKLIELKHKYKYRLILDESISFGTVGRTGRGLTELYNVPATQIDLLLGSVANGLNSSGGFCAGSRVAIDHQRINGTSFVFSAAVPALLAVSASEGINILRNTPSILSTLQENIRAIRTVLDRVDYITISSHPVSPIIHIFVHSPSTTSAHTQHMLSNAPAKPSNPASPVPRDALSFDIVGEERVLQDIVDEALAQGVWITRARRLRGQEVVEARPCIRLAVTTALSRKECERAAGIIKAAAVKVLAKRK
ncbi:serine palmitoyltransferase [Multifurca ochricompacta]|uniref:serine C-palmitoyltransferase n=1 Tax=Multifurca ochricompacta TaxID=376703 RepID=A0AAD4QK82_9AGAM|nr:serine palmitoyltransferase [Multifurca ochricompacta]